MLLSFLLLLSGPCSALHAQTPVTVPGCNCQTSGLGEAFCAAVQIFEGVVLAVDTSFTTRNEKGGPHRSKARIDVLFKVVRSWKGPSGTAVVRTSNKSDGCGFHFALGGSYLVFANPRDNSMITDRCTPTRQLASVGDDLRESLAFIRDSYDWDGKEEVLRPCR
ncbi:MAG: hypothetical protein IPN44_12685 [Flavobacteriales bacterium]|nr:hypothetical protein [Flavobacteriales bacterium]